MKLKVLKYCLELNIPLQGFLYLFSKQKDISDYHHTKYDWRYWTYIENTEIKTKQMPEKYCKLMIAIWLATKPNAKQWYYSNRQQIIIHPATRFWIEEKLSKL